MDGSVMCFSMCNIIFLVIKLMNNRIMIEYTTLKFIC